MVIWSYYADRFQFPMVFLLPILGWVKLEAQAKYNFCISPLPSCGIARQSICRFAKFASGFRNVVCV